MVLIYCTRFLSSLETEGCSLMNTLLPPMQKQLVNILAFLVILLRVSVIDQY